MTPFLAYLFGYGMFALVGMIFVAAAFVDFWIWAACSLASRHDREFSEDRADDDGMRQFHTTHNED